MKRLTKQWILSAAVIGIAYACGGSAEVSRDNEFGSGATTGEGGDGNGTGQGASTSGGTVNVGKGGSSSRGGRDGAGGGEGGDVGAGGASGPNYPDDVTFDYDPTGTGQGGACAGVVGEATLVKRPMDIIISIDNSGSMAGEIAAVVDRINDDFAAIIEASGIDYRVIMVSRYGYLNYSFGDTNYSVCIGPPLGNEACGSNSAPPLVNTERFFHHSTDIGSNNMWCRLIGNRGTASGGTVTSASYQLTDEFPSSRGGWTPVLPDGWGAVLRESSFKVFIGITDDNPATNSGGTSQRCRTDSGFSNNLAGARNFDRALRLLAPEHFGTYDEDHPDGEGGPDRNYRWYSIVGMAPKAGAETEPYQPDEDIVTQVCQGGQAGSDDDGQGAGQGYQYLSRMTGGLRYSNCLNDDFDAIFNAIAEGVIEGAQASCEYDVPVPQGGIVNPDQTTVQYEPGGSGDPLVLEQVDDDAACGSADGFYFDAGADKLFLCPATCATVQADPQATVKIDFGCLGS